MNKLLLMLLFIFIFYSCLKEKEYINLRIDDKMIRDWEIKNIDGLTKCCHLFKGSSSEVVLRRAFKRMVRKRVLRELGELEENASIEFYELYQNDYSSLIDVVINDKKVKSYSFNYLKNEIISIENKNGLIFNRNRREMYSNFNDNHLPCCDINDGAHPSVGIYSLLSLQKKGNLKLVKTATL